MLRNKRFISFIMSLVLVLGLVIMPSMSFAQEETLSLTIVHVNDIHGRVNDVEDTTIGYARLKSIVDSLKADDPNLLLLDAGDTFHGTNFANFSEGETIVNLMNNIGFDAMVPGNHDFNYGSTRLLELAESANFPVLGANIVDEEGGANVLESYEIITMENGLEVGIFGISTEETKVKSHPNNTIGIDFEDPISVAQDMVAELEDKGVDFIIALSHIGVDEESDPTTEDIAEAVDGIDVIVDGHSHSTLEEGKLIDDTLIVQASSHMASIGIVEIELSGVEVNKKASLISYEDAQAYEEDQEIAKFIADIDKENDEILSQVIGTTKVLLDGVRDNVRTGETNLGNLITDAMLNLTDADVVLTNGGGIRESIPAGDITMNDILTVLPFANYPAVIEVTGQTIVDALEYGTESFPESAGAFPHVAGMSYEINFLAPDGERIENVLIGGEPIDLEENYNLVTNDFMAAGGDGYTMFEGAPVVEDFNHLLLSDVLIGYIQDLDEVNPLVEGRIVVTGAPIEYTRYGQKALEHTRYLSKELSGPRTAGTEYEIEAAEYIKGEFERIGYEARLEEFSFERRDENYDSQNVIAIKEGNSPRQVVFGAHYDQVSSGGSEGAQDNASGVGAMLEVAERLKDVETEYTIVFVAFGSEEVGLRGSQAFVDDMTEEDLDNTIAMINLDSIIAGDYAYVYAGTNGIGWGRELALEISNELGLDLISQDGLHPDHKPGETGDWSDHVAFNRVGIPIMYFESTNWLLQDEDGNYMDGYVETKDQGAIMHSANDNLDFIEEHFPGRIGQRFNTMTRVLERLLIDIEPLEFNGDEVKAYLQGYTDKTVKPNGNITRQEAATVLYRLLTDDYKDKMATRDHNFTDVNSKSNSWSEEAIATLARAGVTHGYPDNSFRPRENITRAEVTKLVSQFEARINVAENDFVDVNGHWAKDYINSSADKAWIVGYPDQTFKPNQNMTRAEFVTLVNRVLDREIDLDNLPEDAVTFPDLNESAWYYEEMMAAINNL